MVNFHYELSYIYTLRIEEVDMNKSLMSNLWKCEAEI